MRKTNEEPLIPKIDADETEEADLDNAQPEHHNAQPEHHNVQPPEPHDDEPQPAPVIHTRSGRIVKPPQRYLNERNRDLYTHHLNLMNLGCCNKC